MHKIALLTLAICASLQVRAQTSFVVRLDSAQEFPPNSSTATGSGTLTLNADSSLSYNIAYSGLTNDFQAAHIHGPAGVGANASVLFPLSNVATNARSGALQGTTPALTPVQAGYLTNGLLYANIHTLGSQDGEIRGQIGLSSGGHPINDYARVNDGHWS